MKKIVSTFVILIISILFSSCSGRKDMGYYKNYVWGSSCEEVENLLESDGAIYDENISGMIVEERNISKKMYTYYDRKTILYYNENYLNTYLSDITFKFDEGGLEEVVIMPRMKASDQDFDELKGYFTELFGEASSSNIMTSPIYKCDANWETESSSIDLSVWANYLFITYTRI